LPSGWFELDGGHSLQQHGAEMRIVVAFMTEAPAVRQILRTLDSGEFVQWR
jgi:hypothetical protein